MKVLHTSTLRGWSGEVNRILVIARELNKIEDVSVSIATHAESELAVRAAEAGVEVHTRLTFPRGLHPVANCADVRALRRLIRATRPDIVHTHGSTDTWSMAAALLGLKPRPVFFRSRHNSFPPKVSAIHKFLYHKVIDHLVCVSDSVRRDFEPFMHAGSLSRSRIDVIHSSVDCDRFSGTLDSSAARAEFEIDPEAPVIGVVARLSPSKGVNYFLRAARLIRDKLPAAHFIVVGDGDERPFLQHRAVELGVGDCTHFAGFRNDVPELMASMDICVLPSIGCDASSGVIKQAMASRRPVVATTVGGAAEILEEGKTGLLVPPSDPEAISFAVLQLWSDTANRREMGERARRVVTQRFSNQVLAEKTYTLYKRALAQRRQG